MDTEALDRGKRWLDRIEEKIEFLLKLEEKIDYLLEVVGGIKVVEETPTPTPTPTPQNSDVEGIKIKSRQYLRTGEQPR